jgi:hypothetical protein
LNGIGSRDMLFDWNMNALWHYIPPPTCLATASSGHCLFILALGQWESMNNHETTPIWMMKPLAQMAWAVGTCHLSGIAMPFAKADHFRPSSV